MNVITELKYQLEPFNRRQMKNRSNQRQVIYQVYGGANANQKKIKQKQKNNEESLRNLQGHFKQRNLYITGTTKREQKENQENQEECLLIAVVEENISNLG